MMKKKKKKHNVKNYWRDFIWVVTPKDLVLDSKVRATWRNSIFHSDGQMVILRENLRLNLVFFCIRTNTLLSEPFFHLLDCGVLKKDFKNRLRSSLRMRCMLLGYRFKPRPHGPVLGTAGSVRSIRLSINGCSHSENQFDERKQDWPVQRFDLQRLQRLDPIQAEPPLLLLDQQEDKGDSAHRLQYEALMNTLSPDSDGRHISLCNITA